MPRKKQTPQPKADESMTAQVVDEAADMQAQTVEEAENIQAQTVEEADMQAQAAAEELLGRTLQAKELPQEITSEITDSPVPEEAAVPDVSVDTRNALEQRSQVQNGIGRLVFVGISVILEILALLWIIAKAGPGAELISVAARLLAFFLVLRIYSKNKTASMKMPWILLIMAFPVVGTALYLLVGNSGSTGKMRLRFAVVDTKLFPKMPQNNQLIDDFQKQDRQLGNVASYLKSYSGFPVYKNTDITYYPDASEALEAQKEAMRSAEKFIFMEYHAIEDGEAFHGLEEILVQKAKEGVEVRLFYDDMGSIGFINTDFIDRMEKLGIRCRVFNPFIPGIRLVLNNRDHRKVTVIDGKIGFTGGYNIANEYFNLTHPFGHWKDTGIRLEGEAVRSLTVMFLEMWNAVRADDVDDRECDQFLEAIEYTAQEVGFVQPYADSPLDDEQVGENIYISLIEQAEKTVWFMTPYLILTDEMIHALGLAAKRGVDVRIITPGIPDKKLVYSVTRSYYHSLAKNGVRIFEYTPGFMHAKQCIVDEKAAVCGTINLDYRSLYHHF